MQQISLRLTVATTSTVTTIINQLRNDLAVRIFGSGINCWIVRSRSLLPSSPPAELLFYAYIGCSPKRPNLCVIPTQVDGVIIVGI